MQKKLSDNKLSLINLKYKHKKTIISQQPKLRELDSSIPSLSFIFFIQNKLGKLTDTWTNFINGEKRRKNLNCNKPMMKTAAVQVANM